MKKALTAVLIIALMFALVGCQTYLFGKYTNEESGKSFEFSSDTVTYIDGDETLTGTYVIKSGNITFTFDEIEYVYTYSRSGTDTIIDGITYVRGE
ncbi:MAG: hypothetical protein WCY62_06280 [Clostridia bacterium]